MRAWIEIPASAPTGLVPVKVDVDDYFVIKSIGRAISVGSHGYAQMFRPPRSCVLLHRLLLGLTSADGRNRIGDHINGDRLDNRRSNLRIVDPSGSSQNVRGRGKSRFRGVHPTRGGRWMARVKFHGVNHIVGTFTDELDAARAAHEKRLELMSHYVPRPGDLADLYPDSESAA